MAEVEAAIDAEPAIGYLAEGMFGVEPTPLLDATPAPRIVHLSRRAVVPSRALR